jgi:hypothetical protein
MGKDGRELVRELLSGSEVRREERREGKPKAYAIRARGETMERFRRLARGYELPQEEMLRVLMDVFERCVGSGAVEVQVRSVVTGVTTRASVSYRGALARGRGEGGQPS